MNLILQAIKSLFRGLENRISAKIAELTPRFTRVENTLKTVSNTTKTVRNTANEAKSTAQKALTLAESKPDYVRFDWGSHPIIGYYDVKPRTHTNLNPGENVILEHKFTSEFFDALPSGSRVSINVYFYIDDNETATSKSVVLEKLNYNNLQGGVWFIDNAGLPRYYQVNLNFGGTTSKCYRYV